jgi:uncharacterized membrane protein
VILTDAVKPKLSFSIILASNIAAELLSTVKEPLMVSLSGILAVIPIRAFTLDEILSDSAILAFRIVLLEL